MNINPGTDSEILEINLNMNINANLVIQICILVIKSINIQNKSASITMQLNKKFGCKFVAFVVQTQKDKYAFKFSNYNKILIFNFL